MLRASSSSPERALDLGPAAAVIRRLVVGTAVVALAACGAKPKDPFVASPSPDCSPPGTPVVSAASAPAGPATEPTVCQQPIIQSALPASQVKHLGTVPVNRTAAFDVPPATGSFTIVLQAVTASTADVTFVGAPPLPNAPVPLKITDPAGGTFYDDTSTPLDPTRANAVYRGGRQGWGTFTAPNTAPTLSAWARGVPAGRWSFVVGDYAAECQNLGPAGCTAGADTSGVYDVTVLLRPGPVPTTGTIDVDFYLATAQFSASTAVTDPGMARMVSTLGAIYANAGICLGKVTFIDLPAWAKAKYSTLDATDRGPCGALAQLFTLSLPDAALPLFLVDQLQNLNKLGQYEYVVGIDAAIPGPSSMGGTLVSGAAIGISCVGPGSCAAGVVDPDKVAAVAAHEGGHWLGLFHTTEENGAVFDPLSDTGVCDCSQCVAEAYRSSCGTSSAEVGTAVCSTGGSCSGGDNLMFWLMGGTAISAQQAQVMRANPLVR